MKGTFLDFLELLNENEALRKDVVDVAGKHGFEFSDEVSDEDLEAVAGGVDALVAAGNADSVRSNRQEIQTAFENFDQKSNQLFNILSTVMKSVKEMRSGVTRNLL